MQTPRYRKRCKRYNTPGHFHYLTFSCFRRQKFLLRDRSREWLADAIRAAKEKHPFRLIAYVFMPEHAHLMIFPVERPYSISAILKMIKLPVAIKARRFVMDEAPEFLEHMMDVQPNGEHAIRFWQRGGGYDRNIISAEELWEKINYIHNNPVKRNLVDRAIDWRWSSAADYAKVRQGPLAIDNSGLPWLPQ